MTPRGKLFLALAATGGAFALLASGKNKASAAILPEPEPEEEETLPDTPASRVPDVRIPPGELPSPPPRIPPPIQFDQRDEKDIEDDELRGGPPPFVPQPNEPPPPAEVPDLPVRSPVQVPPELQDVPDLLEQIPGLVPSPQTPGGIDLPARPKPPLQSPPEQPEVTVLRDDTADVLGAMLPKEQTRDWKRKEPVLELWQEERGRPVDGRFGPGDALVMAKESGLLPIVRFWPKGSLIETGAVDDYRRELLREAARAEEPRKSQLKAASEREKGQAFSRNPEPIVPTIQL